MERTKIVVDTNIFVSAFLGSKNAKFLIKEIINDEYELVMGKDQFREIETVLKRPKFSKYISEGEVDEFMGYLSLKIIMPAIYDTIHDCRDEKDNMILEGAVYGNAKYIITGDEDLLVLNPYRWIEILTLRQFISHEYNI